MDKDREIAEIVESLRTFIELSQQDEDKPWHDWIAATVKNIEVLKQVIPITELALQP